MVSADIKLALSGFKRFMGFKALTNRQIQASKPIEAHSGQVPACVALVFAQKAGQLSQRDGRDILVVHATLSKLTDLEPERLSHILFNGELEVSILEQFFYQPDLEFEQAELLRVLRQTQYFKLTANAGLTDDLSAYELALQWIKQEQYWAVEKLIQALPSDELQNTQRYIRSLIACSPLYNHFRIPVRLAIEIALQCSEVDHQGNPLNDVENLLRARLYQITPSDFPKDAASLALTDYRNRRLNLLNHALISHQGALQVYEQIRDQTISELLACNVLSSLIRIGNLHSDELLMQMVDLLHQRRAQQSQTQRPGIAVNS